MEFNQQQDPEAYKRRLLQMMLAAYLKTSPNPSNGQSLALDSQEMTPGYSYLQNPQSQTSKRIEPYQGY